jgi:DNA-directed RNA polymerase subunit H (RpoH/RPB5)
MDDTYEIFYDHMGTLDSFLKVNGYINTNPDYTDLDPDDFFAAINSIYTSNKELSNVIGDTNEFRAMFSGIFEHKAIKNKRIFVYFCSAPLGDNMTGRVQHFLRILCQIKNCKNGVIIVDREFSASAIKSLNSVKDLSTDSPDVYNIKMFTDKTFIDIVNNNFVPKVKQIMSIEEAKKFCKDNRVNSIKLPKMIVDEPLCSFYMANIGNIMVLERDTGISDNILSTQLVYKYVTTVPFKRKAPARR